MIRFAVALVLLALRVPLGLVWRAAGWLRPNTVAYADTSKYDSIAGRGPMDVEHHTADDTLTVDDLGMIHTNNGAAGTITLILPAARVGSRIRFCVEAAQQLRIDPSGTETISLPSTGVPGAAGKYLVADAIGETVELMCSKAGSWRVFGFTGTWTAEA